MKNPHITLLKKARKIIKSGQEEYLCNAISLAANKYRNSERWTDVNSARNELLEYISASLGKDPKDNLTHTYGTWLVHHHGDLLDGAEALDVDMGHIGRAGRLAWIEYLIIKFKEIHEGRLDFENGYQLAS